MDKICRIPFRPLLLFSGCLALLLILRGRSQTRPASSMHTVPAQGCKENDPEGGKCESRD
jgi:hypothetical protein